ncbi:TRAP transporter small permease [Chelativorans alearense]|uniref:TRAP transporter small permease n=1 Tax=Chelativorans alearense TaxID=2681495 RepID=UPI0013D2F143|nr:TRAP transporter small permease [Chelativorans alearense]
MPLIQFLIRAHRNVTVVAFAVAGAALVLFTAVFNIEVARRYFLNAPSTWSQDVIAVCALAVIFLAMPYVTMKQGHVRIDILLRKMGPAGEKAVTSVSLVLAVIILGAVAWITGIEAHKQFLRGTQTASSIAIPKWPLLALMAWGFLSSALHVLSLPFVRDDAQ